MDTQWMPEHDVGEETDPPTYRVRIWTPPAIEGYAWAVDEYEVSDVPDVREALAWAEEQAAGRPMEFFVKWFDTGIRPNYDVFKVPQMTRLFGFPPDEG